ncbi:MAG: class I SAM-dependent methyltransferase [Phycisphaerales bacterium]|nr:class I SAM-dependent methyltransferase [Phycisphaerales bacterium]
MENAETSQATWTAVDALIEQFMLPRDEVLEGVLRRSEIAGLPSIAVSPAQGKLLHVLARLCAARRILEIGTLGGYSTIWMARALARDRGPSPAAGVVTLEINADYAAVAMENFRDAGVADLIDLRVGPAMETLAELQSQSLSTVTLEAPGSPGALAAPAAPFDMVFIDADKASSAAYLRMALPLCRAGAVVIIDTVVRNGAIVAPPTPHPDPRTRGSLEALELMGTIPSLYATAIQTVGIKGYDGFAIGIVGERA